MSRVSRSTGARKRRRAVLKLAKGYRHEKRAGYRAAKQQLDKSLSYAYRDRRNRKRDFRRLWITRINAAARKEGMSYSQLMNGLRKSGNKCDRKMLSELAVSDPDAFRSLADTARKQAGA
jgi:large subunit ribosomal protein L20